jgi:Fur family transcriptional regulator, ferric uptake regulator
LRMEAVVGKIRGRGYKATPQRLAVLGALAAEQHQTLEEIRARCPEVGLVTVYRTLDLLCEIGAVRRLDLGDGPRYELAENHHHHLVCESCGAVSEFEECPLDLRRLQDVDFEVASHSLEIYGRCVVCR